MNGGFFVLMVGFVGLGYGVHELVISKFSPKYGGFFVASWFGFMIVVAAFYALAISRTKCRKCGARIQVAINNDEEFELPEVCPKCGGEI